MTRITVILAAFAALLEDSVEELYENAPCGYLSTDVDGFTVGHRYKFKVYTRDGHALEKADPFAAQSECAPATGSISPRARLSAPPHASALPILPCRATCNQAIVFCFRMG